MPWLFACAFQSTDDVRFEITANVPLFSAMSCFNENIMQKYREFLVSPGFMSISLNFRDLAGTKNALRYSDSARPSALPFSSLSRLKLGGVANLTHVAHRYDVLQTSSVHST
jgi:hypothetical protein